MKRLRAAALVAVLTCLSPVLARAGSISISMTATASVKDGALEVALKISNSGDEAANSVVPILRLRDREARGSRRDSLAPGDTIEDTLRVPMGDLGSGRWPFRVATDYTDANQYPFQALHVAVVTVGDPSPSKVAVSDITIPAVSESGTVSMKIKNLAAAARDAEVTVFAPDGLEVLTPTQQVTLKPWESVDARADLVNRTALAGSRYPIFVAVEYDDGGVHQTLVANGTVEIQQRRALVAHGLLWVVGALVVAWVILLVRRRMA